MTDGRPLDGVKIVDLTHVLAGPYCTYILALLGANVIKIENVDSGDVVRQAGPRRDLNEIGMGSHYQAQGGDKRCIAVDIASDGGKAVLARLIATADVFIENLRPGATSGHGFDPATLRARHPRLICARVSGFGADQPRRAYDNVVQAASGIVASTGPEGGPAVKAGPAVVDYATGLTAALARRLRSWRCASRR
ncbi:MAG: CoA transferase [Dongiaceae bacterium]